MGVGRLVYTGVKQGAKYMPVVTAVVHEVRGPATEYARGRLEAARHRRLAVTKAASVRDGTVLEVLHGEHPVWVVYSGDEPISAHPDLGLPLSELVAHADLDRRLGPEAFPTVRERAGSVSRRTAARVRHPRGGSGGPGTSPTPQDAP